MLISKSAIQSQHIAQNPTQLGPKQYIPRDLSATLLQKDHVNVPTWNYRWSHLAIFAYWLGLILLAKQAANRGLDSFLFVAAEEKKEG